MSRAMGAAAPHATSGLRIIVTGLAGLYPLGGVAFDYLQYVLGFARLGHDVVYHEDTWSWPYHPRENRHVGDGSYSAAFLERFFASYAPALAGRWHYLHLHETSHGLTRSAFAEFARTADLFINVSGAGMIPDELGPHTLKVFLDTDPGYNQIMLCERFAWSEHVERWCASVAAHDRHFTYAENMGGPGCTIPAAGFRWRTTRMPVVLDLWAPLVARAPGPGAPWTTVMTWNAWKGRLVHAGIEYESKGAQFERIIDLPRAVPVKLEVAVGGAGAPRARLAAHGWRVADGPASTLSAEQYQEFIAGSRAELSPAKHVYVATRSGWFSCRSACYLAAGRPAVVEDTGFGSTIPTGRGLLAYRTPAEAAAAIGEVEGDYAAHAAAARAIAAEHFDSDRVLARLLADAEAA